MRKSFTLIEVAVSVILLFTIGLALSDIAKSNTDILFKSKDTTYGKFSFLAYDPSEFKDFKDYLKIKEIPIENGDVKKRVDFLYSLSLPLNEKVVISLEGNKESLKIGEATNAFFRFK